MRRFPILQSNESDSKFAPWSWRDNWYAKGESAFSLLAKFQCLNVLSFSDLLDAFVLSQSRGAPGRDVDLRDARSFDLPRMMDVLRLRLPEIASAFVMPSWRIGKIGAPALRWCEKCAREGAHLTVFQYRNVEECPLHHTRLHGRCEHCGTKIPYRLRSDIFKAPFNCPSCAQPWWLPALGPDDLTVGRGYRTLLRRHAEDTFQGIRLYSGVPRNSHAIGGLPVVAPDAVVDQVNSWRVTDAQWIMSGLCRTAAVDDPPIARAKPEDPDSEIDVEARACYKAVRRRLMHLYGGAHRACISSAARHLCWPLTGRTTTSFCPVALALLRWRCKWEGIGVPRALLEPELHAPLGLAVWLSLYVPIAPKSWDQRAIRWMTLRLLVQACMDSFRFFLMEAMDAGERRQILWLPFPIHEFPERMTLVRGGTDQDNSLGVCALLRGNAGLGQWPASVPSAGDHYCRHTLQLRKNVDPMSAS